MAGVLGVKFNAISKATVADGGICENLIVVKLGGFSCFR